MNKFKKLLLEFPHTSSLIEIWVSRLLIISLLSVSFSTTILNGYIHFVRQTNVSIKERKKPFKPLKKDKKKKTSIIHSLRRWFSNITRSHIKKYLERWNQEIMSFESRRKDDMWGLALAYRPSPKSWLGAKRKIDWLF